MATVETDPGGEQLFGILQDVTAEKEIERRLWWTANHDPLTDLPNRMLFQSRLAEAIEQARGERTLVGLVVLDVDNFKTVNDVYGHDAGDLLLVRVAELLRASTRAADTVARLGGDEFTVVQPDVDHDDAPTLLARRLLALLREPVTVGGRVAWPRVSIGTAVSPDDGADADVLAANANLALRRAAAAGGNVALRFDPNADPAAHARTRRRHALAAAIDADALQVRFQPKVALGSGEVVGAEALVRWFPPDGDEIPPAEFIPLAEASGLVVPLGRHVLTQACRRAVGWPAGWRVAVNLSPIQLARDDVVGLVEGALADSGLAAHRLELEITETTLLEELDRSCDQLGRLRELGTTIALDDFGTGFSSLAMLWRLPIDVLKLDRAFLSDLDVDPRIVDVVAEVIAMARHLHLQTVAEGVETTRQRDVLRDLGCDLAQGFLFGSASADPAAHRALTPACVPVPRGRA